MAEGSFLTSRGTTIGARAPKPPAPPRTYTIPKQYVPSTYHNPSGGPVSGNLSYLLGVLNPGKAPVSLGATSMPGWNVNMFGGNAPAAPSTGGGGGGYSYDINSDPGVLAARAAYNQGVTQLDSWLRGERTGAVVNFGDPSMVIPGWNVDPNTAAAAKANYASGNATLARLDNAHTINARNIINTLAAHGIIGSGDLGYRQGQENQSYGNGVYDARQAVLNTLNQDQQNYLDRKNALQSAVTAAIQQAYANQLAMAQSGAGLS